MITRNGTAKEVRVAHFIIAPKLGGAEKLVTELLSNWSYLEKHQPYLIVQYDQIGDHAADDHNLNLNFTQPWRDAPSIFRAVRSVRRFIEANDIDVLHSHWWLPDLVAAISVLGKRVRHIAHIHTMSTLYMPEGFLARKFLCQTAHRLAKTDVIACSREVGIDFRERFGISKDKLFVLPNAVDVEKYSNDRSVKDWELGGRTIRVLTAGRLVKSKGHELVISAIHTLRRQGWDIVLTIAGEGDERRNIEAQTRQLNLDRYVKLVGRVECIAGLLGKTDIVVQASIGSEGMPVTVLEAMSTECVVVCSRTAGGVSEFVENGRTGYLFEAGAVDSLVQVLLKIFGDSAERLFQLTKTARATVKREHSLNSYVEELESIYRASDTSVSNNKAESVRET